MVLNLSNKLIDDCLIFLGILQCIKNLLLMLNIILRIIVGLKSEMLKSDRIIFDVSIGEYTERIYKFLQERVAPHEIKDSVNVELGNSEKSKDKKIIKSVTVHIKNKKFISDLESPYRIRMQEKVIPENERSVSTRKYTYELKNVDDPTDFIRFDYKQYKEFPHLHINSDPNVWGDHLTYPDTININLNKIDIIKALNIFEKYIHHQDCHILDSGSNYQYLEIIG